jgi:hypothetical protein
MAAIDKVVFHTFGRAPETLASRAIAFTSGEKTVTVKFLSKALRIERMTGFLNGEKSFYRSDDWNAQHFPHVLTKSGGCGG